MRFQSRVRRTSKYKSAKTGEALKSTVKSTIKQPEKTLNTVKKAVQSAKELRDAISTQDVPSLVRIATKLGGERKSPVGSNGLNLQPIDMRKVTIMSESQSGFTNSAAMYMYRPPRKRVPDAIQYCMKRTVDTTTSSSADAQNILDLNLLDAQPVENNPGTNADYTPISIKKVFDKYLDASVVEGSTLKVTDTSQASVHIKSLTAEMTIKNLSGNGAMIDLYDLVPNYSIGPSSYSSETYANGWMSPSWTFQQGLTQTMQLEDTMSAYDLGAKPSNSTFFNVTWKEVKHTRINLTSGAAHRHRSIYSINKTVSYSEWGQFSVNGGKFAGWNPTILMVVRGVPTAEANAGATSIKIINNIQLNYEATPDRQSKVIVYDSAT